MLHHELPQMAAFHRLRCWLPDDIASECEKISHKEVVN